METLISSQENNSDLSSQTYEEIVSLIYNNPDQKNSDIDQGLEDLILQQEGKISSYQKHISVYNKPRNSRDLQLRNQYQKLLDETQAIRKDYIACRELNIYRTEKNLDLENYSIEELFDRYRAYKKLLDSIDTSQSSPVSEDIKTIIDVYNEQILKLIEETQVDQKYGFGNAESKPLEIDFLEHLTIPDTNNPEFTRYKERLLATQQGNTRLLTDGQQTTIQDDLRGSDSEKQVNEELIQVPGVLATIDIPKFSIGDTRHKADTIVITLNSELRDSIDDQKIQLSIYRLIEEYKSVLLNHLLQYGENSLVNPKDEILGNIIKVNKNINLDDIAPDLKTQVINLSDILNVHKIQIKTRSNEMPRAFQDYKNSSNAIDPDKVGFLAREYYEPGSQKSEEFNKIEFQIAAQKILGLPIK